MAYWSPQALGALAQSESSGQASLVHYPNNVAWGGNSTAGSSASGLYGYLTSTWRTYAPQAGVDLGQYPYAYTAPASVQTQVAAITPISNWTCPGCNSTASALAENPANISASPVNPGSSAATDGLGDLNLSQINDPAYQTGMPTYGDISASDTTGLPYGDSTSQLQAMGYSPDQIAQLQQEGYYGGSLHVNVTPQAQTGTGGGTASTTGVGASGAGQPIQLNLGSGTVADISKWVTAPITAAEQELAAGLQSLGNWFSRGFLIILGIVIILVALWKVSGSPSPAVIMEAA